ncbi:hypothetical protein [Nocardia brasiliensis]|uniref:hypothetical protein n=1 Tax=Nocardia brasiliensis TaxID=37326 RepID=UPI002453C76D|nr:hypothetical protein [Nocardia brasiliensis]
MAATTLPAGWSIRIKPSANIDILTLIDESGAEIYTGYAPGRREPDPSELVVHRLRDIRSQTLRDHARALIQALIQRRQSRVATVNANIAAYTAAVPDFNHLAERLRRDGITIATDIDDSTLVITTTLTASGPAAGALMTQLGRWLATNGLDEVPAGITLELDEDTLALTIAVDQRHAAELLPWLHRQPEGTGLDRATSDALRSVLTYNFDDEHTDYHQQDHDDRQGHILNDLSATARWLFTTTAATTPVELPAELRGALPADYTSAHVASIMSRVHDATGYRIVCLWDYHDDQEFGGHTEFHVVDEFGQLYELAGDLLGWLHGGLDAPAEPGSPAGWIGVPGSEDHVTTADLAAGQDRYNYTVRGDKVNSCNRTATPKSPWRILVSGAENPSVLHYISRSARDRAAQYWADRTGQTVCTELWDPTHPQDALNLGWACDGTVEPSTSATVTR